MTAAYLFGDTDLAARRLRVLAEAFEPSSRAFITFASKARTRLAVDLGCGPGHTTHMLAAALPGAQVVGLDNSLQFLRQAEKTATDQVSFRLHDVNHTPFPVSPCDAIYARFLLTHQKSPEQRVTAWVSQLAPGGRLLLEETDAIHVEVSAFNQYVEIVAAMLADSGYDLCVGKTLQAMPTPAGVVLRESRQAIVPMANDLAAELFSMNIQTWKHNDFVQRNCSPESIQVLETDLAELAAMPTSECGIAWELRQLVYERENDHE